MNHPNKQDRKVALITGAARRIGASIAQRLHAAGFDIVIHCHQSQSAAYALAYIMNHERENSATVIMADLSEKKQVTQLMLDSIDWHQRLDVLVNNASLFMCTPHDPLDDSEWERLWHINVRAPFWLSHLAFPYLSISQGIIINITDIHAEQPLKNYSMYCQTKAALTMQTKALAREFAPNVRVNAIAPGAIAWPEHENALSEGIMQKIIDKTPLKQKGNPLYIAQAVQALVENPFITGQTLRVDGGRLS